MKKIIDVKPSQYVFIWTAMNYSTNNIMIIDEDDVSDYMCETFGFEEEHKQNVLDMEHGDVNEDDYNGLKIIKI